MIRLIFYMLHNCYLSKARSTRFSCNSSLSSAKKILLYFSLCCSISAFSFSAALLLHISRAALISAATLHFHLYCAFVACCVRFLYALATFYFHFSLFCYCCTVYFLHYLLNCLRFF